MRYYLDTEFNGFGGVLLSLALVRDDAVSLYLVSNNAERDATDPWVAENVAPLLYNAPSPLTVRLETFGQHIANFLHGDPNPIVIADWPDDIRHLCSVLITGPGTMVDIPGITFEVRRVDAYPNDGSPQLPDAVQHNAWWDAMALRYVLTQRALAA